MQRSIKLGDRNWCVRLVLFSNSVSRQRLVPNVTLHALDSIKCGVMTCRRMLSQRVCLSNEPKIFLFSFAVSYVDYFIVSSIHEKYTKKNGSSKDSSRFKLSWNLMNGMQIQIYLISIILLLKYRQRTHH